MTKRVAGIVGLLLFFGAVTCALARTLSLPGNATPRTYAVEFTGGCDGAREAELLLSWTQTNCLDPRGADAPGATFANTDIQFNRYVGPKAGPFSTGCAPGRQVSQFDVLLVLKGTRDGRPHLFVVDCPEMHAGEVDRAVLLPAKSGRFRTTCTCNADRSGIYTSTFWENLRPFLYANWARSNFVSRRNPNE